MTITANMPAKIMTVNDHMEDEKANLKSNTQERNGAKYARERIEFLVKQYYTLKLLACGRGGEKSPTEVLPSTAFARIVTLVRLSPHAAVHMTDTMMDIAKSNIKQEIGIIDDKWGLIARRGVTLGQFAATNHVEYAISLLQERHLMGEQNDYKREILRLQNDDGVTVREVCMAKVSSFLRRTRKEEEEHILY